ncbi:MAG TPA: DUF1194 domain-containing protein [Ferrovibrio sp.]|uniref:DUF1194 domain-containing protein n=1 Tax=Ferrovibrio sp. TaxID=1917215 RepID=UPI002ED063AF
MPVLLLTGCMAAGFAGAGEAAEEKIAVDLELQLAVDISGSIDADEARLQREGYARAISDPAVVKAIQSGINGRIAVSYFEWSDSYSQQDVFGWMLIQDQASAEAVARRLIEFPIRTARRTSISGAILHALPRFGSSPYKGLRRVLDISGDGPNNDGSPVDLARDQAVNAGIVINGLPIINDRPNSWGFPVLKDLDRYYEGCVTGGPGSFVVVAESFETFFEAIRRKLILEVAALPARPETLPRHGPLVRIQRNAGYDKGCDIGERQSQDFWRRRYEQ